MKVPRWRSCFVHHALRGGRCTLHFCTSVGGWPSILEEAVLCLQPLPLSSSSPNVLTQRKRKVILLGPGFFQVWPCFWPGFLLFLSFTFSVFKPLPLCVLMLGLFLLLENPSSSSSVLLDLLLSLPLLFLLRWLCFLTSLSHPSPSP